MNSFQVWRTKRKFDALFVCDMFKCKVKAIGVKAMSWWHLWLAGLVHVAAMWWLK